jgi:hypothetical protein
MNRGRYDWSATDGPVRLLEHSKAKPSACISLITSRKMMGDIWRLRQQDVETKYIAERLGLAVATVGRILTAARKAAAG